MARNSTASNLAHTLAKKAGEQERALQTAYFAITKLVDDLPEENRATFAGVLSEIKKALEPVKT